MTTAERLKLRLQFARDLDELRLAADASLRARRSLRIDDDELHVLAQIEEKAKARIQVAELVEELRSTE